MPTDAQRRAKAKYTADKVKQVSLAFYPTEADLLAHLAKQPQKQTYLKDLIRKDMDKTQQ